MPSKGLHAIFALKRSPLKLPPSPLVGLGCTPAFLAVVTLAYAIYVKIDHVLAARSAYRSDIERPADPLTVKCNVELKTSTSADDVLAAAKLPSCSKRFTKRSFLRSLHYIRMSCIYKTGLSTGLSMVGIYAT
ncbi:hypothetical protein R3P38DRAFT_3258312 [Favolaschia claudopus]|uniref:Uncharacterized protein n=1 Tax=Favolaschia claudopus TaxID=2862362 RepID=A0AAW0D6K4_9AGAR